MQLMLPIIVKKSNELCRAKWSPKSIQEPRLVALVAAQIRTDDKDFHTYRIPVTDVLQEEAHGLGGADYKRLKELAENIVGSTIMLEKKNRKGFAVYGIFAECEYKEGAFYVQFHPKLKQHYLNLQKQFTEYNLLEFMKLHSIYSQRLFEILRSWDDKPEIELDLADLQERLSVPASLKKDFKDFRIRVLEQAHREITKKTSLRYEWEAIKKGRKVVGVRFIFSKKRAAPVAKAKKAVNDQKQANVRNSLFKQALSCRQTLSKGGGPGSCSGDRGRVCEICATIPR